VAVEKHCVTYSESLFVALDIQHAKRLRHIVIYGLPGSTTFFPHYPINGTILEKVVKHKMCVSIFPTTLSETFLILRRNERDIIKNLYWSSCKVAVIHVRF